MQQHQSNQPWPSDDVPVGPTASANSGEFTPDPGHSSVGETLARIPNLDATESFPSSDAGSFTSHSGKGRSNSRLLSQALSIKLLLGGGVLLVLAAIIVVNRPSRPSPDDDSIHTSSQGLPAPEAESAPTWTNTVAPGSQAPIVPPNPWNTASGSPNLQSAPPSLDYQPNLPELPGFATTPPSSPNPAGVPQMSALPGHPQYDGQTPAPTAPSNWAEQNSRAAAEDRLPVPNVEGPAAQYEARRPNHGYYQQYPNPSASQSTATPPHTGTAGGVTSPQATLPQATANRSLRIGDPPVPAPVNNSQGSYGSPSCAQPSADSRYPTTIPQDYRQPNYGQQTIPQPSNPQPTPWQQDYRPGSTAPNYPQTNPMQPPAANNYNYPGNQGASNTTPYPTGTATPTDYRQTYQADTRSQPWPQQSPTAESVQPGVAQFDGIIEKPSARTSYDRARPSVY